MTPEQIALHHVLSDPRVHPGGERIAVTVTRPDVEEDANVSEIHLVDLQGGRRRFTAGPRDGSPRWSPSGDRLAFVRAAEEGEPGQVFVVPFDGGEAEAVTDLPLGAGSPAWSPDGRWLVVAARERRFGLDEVDDDERGRRPRRITELPYRGDSIGWTHDVRTHLWVVDTTGAQDPVCLTPGDEFDESQATWTADGSAVVFVSARQDTREHDASAQVWRLAVGDDGQPDGEPELVLDAGGWGAPVVAPDGELYVGGHRRSFDWPAPPALHRVADDAVVTIGAALDRDLGGLVVEPDGGLLLAMADRGATRLVRLTEGEDEAEVLVGGDRMVTSHHADGGTVAFVATHPSDPGELWVLDADGEPRVLTAFNEELREHLLPTEHVTFERDGVELDAWVLMPEGDDEDVPLLLNIHGGPTAQYGFSFFDEFQVYARAGYAVVGINPRGSSGRGADWSTAVVDAWDDERSVDLLDLDAATDMVLERYPQVSRERLGIMGGSYGGYASARIMAITDRYRSAVVERGLLNWVSFGGTSDIGAYFDRMFMRGQLPEDLERLWAASPVRTADRITTPTLVLHSFEDHRCPPEQALQLFSMLRRNGVESEMLLFPGESHELSRSGSPRHRVERFEAILDWHDRHLGVDRADDSSDSSDSSDPSDDEDGDDEE